MARKASLHILWPRGAFPIETFSHRKNRFLDVSGSVGGRRLCCSVCLQSTWVCSGKYFHLKRRFHGAYLKHSSQTTMSGARNQRARYFYEEERFIGEKGGKLSSLPRILSILHLPVRHRSGGK